MAAWGQGHDSRNRFSARAPFVDAGPRQLGQTHGGGCKRQAPQYHFDSAQGDSTRAMSNPEEERFHLSDGSARAARANPIDPLTGPKLALSGRVVLMDDAFRVIPQGTIYIEQGNIVAVTESQAPRPSGFETETVVDVGGSIFPGLIELHNHLAYNALQLWQVPKKYSNRDQWSGIPVYRKLISGPMQIIGKTPELVQALIRYVECKSLLGGVTTSQGIQLFSNAGIRRFYRVIVRNVEQTAEDALPKADTRVDDIDAKDAKRF